MTEAEKNEIVGLVMTEISSQAVDFDIATEQPQANDLLTAVREVAGRYVGVTLKWDDVARIATELANQAATRAEQALSDTTATKTEVGNMKASVEQTVTDFNALAEEKKQEVQGVYQSDLNELKGDLDDIRMVVGNDSTVVNRIDKLYGMMFNGESIVESSSYYNSLVFKVPKDSTATFTFNTAPSSAIVLNEKPYVGMTITRVDARSPYTAESSDKYIFVTFNITSASPYINVHFNDSGLQKKIKSIESNVSSIGSSVSSIESNIGEINNGFVYELGSNNICPPDTESGYYSTNNGEPISEDGYVRTPKAIKISDTNKYIQVTLRDYKNSFVCLELYTSENATSENFIGAKSFDASSNKVSSFNVDNRTKYIRVWVGSGASDFKFSDMCISQVNVLEFEEYISTPRLKEDALPEYVKKNFGVALPLDGANIVNLGDSIFGNFQTPSDISTYISNLTNANVYNCGFGGCRMAKHNRETFDKFSMYRIAYAIGNNDWSLQESAISDATWADKPSYFNSHLEILKNMDFSKVDIITISYGTNDFMSSIRQENSGDKYDINCYKGALRYSIEQILTRYPNIRIVVCTPIYRSWNNDDGSFMEDSNTKTDIYGKTLIDFGTSCKEVCEEYNLQCIDNYYIGMGKLTRTYYWNNNDYTHPNENGRKLMAKHIVSELY